MKENNYFTHGIHSYHAKFIPDIPKEFLNKYSKEGDVILDPFCGSGTTLLECALSGHKSYGVDLSDIAIKISKAKTFLADVNELDRIFENIKKDFFECNYFEKREFPNKEIWYTEETCLIIDKLLFLISKIPDDNYRNIFEVLISSILKTISNKRNTWNNGYIADNVLPNKPYKGDAFKLFCNKFKHLRDSYFDLKKYCLGKKYVEPEIFLSNILDINLNEKVDMVITSPPYPFAVDFIRYNRLSYYWFGWDIKEKFEAETGSRGKRSRKNALNDFLAEMERIYKHIFNQVKINGYFCMTVGDTKKDKMKISFIDWLIDLFQKNGWVLIANEKRIIQAQSMAQKRIPVESKLVFKKLS